MKNFVKILTGAGVALIAFLALYTSPVDVSSVRAQSSAQGLGSMTPRFGANKIVGAYSGSGVSVTNLHSSATNVAVYIDGRFQSTVGLTVIACGSAAGPATFTIPFALADSSDGTTTSTTLQTIALSVGAGTNVISTNITMYGHGYVYIPYVTNNHASSDITNLIIFSPTKVLSTSP